MTDVYYSQVTNVLAKTMIVKTSFLSHRKTANQVLLPLIEEEIRITRCDVKTRHCLRRRLLPNLRCYFKICHHLRRFHGRSLLPDLDSALFSLDLEFLEVALSLKSASLVQESRVRGVKEVETKSIVLFVVSVPQSDLGSPSRRRYSYPSSPTVSTSRRRSRSISTGQPFLLAPF